MVWQLLERFNIDLPYDPSILFLYIQKNENIGLQLAEQWIGRFTLPYAYILQTYRKKIKMYATTFEGKGELEREEILSFHILNFSELLTSVSKNMYFFL